LWGWPVFDGTDLLRVWCDASCAEDVTEVVHLRPIDAALGGVSMKFVLAKLV
jgi:hypothetical protein